MAHGCSGKEDSHKFNLGILCCLPKKVAGTHSTLGDYYTAADTRPLSIVNTDNRIIASAMKLAWEPIFNKWVSDSQRGFLKGRSMLANILEIDEVAMTISLTEAYGGMVLFDFKAAFPSIEHEYLFKVLEHIGTPKPVLNAIMALYDQVQCILQFKGETSDNIGMTAGVRQGCPLSPLLFAVTVDLLLRRLNRLIPDATFMTFADDIGAIIRDIPKEAALLMSTFADFGKASGLDLNFPKTLVVPLWEGGITEARDSMTKRDVRWNSVAFDDKGAYLGFVLGPGKGDSSWHKAISKFENRVKLWCAQPQGLHQYFRLQHLRYFGALVYRTV